VLSPAERTLRARLGAYELHARRDPSETTRAAREKFAERFYLAVDPHGELEADERERRAAALRRAYYTRLALKSAAARRKRRTA
jgi:L-alanine-DL-glutamate epimerase-like enolase superfamily enzyme